MKEFSPKVFLKHTHVASWRFSTVRQDSGGQRWKYFRISVSPGFWGEGNPTVPPNAHRFFQQENRRAGNFQGVLIKGLLRKNHPLRLYFLGGPLRFPGFCFIDFFLVQMSVLEVYLKISSQSSRFGHFRFRFLMPSKNLKWKMIFYLRSKYCLHMMSTSITLESLHDLHF